MKFFAVVSFVALIASSEAFFGKLFGKKDAVGCNSRAADLTEDMVKRSGHNWSHRLSFAESQ